MLYYGSPGGRAHEAIDDTIGDTMNLLTNCNTTNSYYD